MVILMAATPPPRAPQDLVLGFLRALEAGGGADAINPYLADSFILTEASHLLAPEGAT